MTPDRVLATEIVCIFLGTALGTWIGYVRWSETRRELLASLHVVRQTARYLRNENDELKETLETYRERAGERLV